MNLHGIASPYIGAVNPMIPASLRISDGYSTSDDGTRVPKYKIPALTVLAQVQELTSKDLQKLEGLNLQQSGVAIYLNGALDGAVRVQQKGGDLVTIQSGQSAGVYLVTTVLEQWPDWVKVAGTLQNDPIIAHGV